MGQKKEFEVLQVFEFNSDRKRMSILVRDNGMLKLLVKGADTKIIQHLEKNCKQEFLPAIQEKLDAFSKIGLRTLCIAMRIVEEQEYAEFKERLTKLADHPNREKEIGIIAKN